MLLPYAGSIVDADRRLASRVDDDLLRSIVQAIPDAWLGDGADDQREAYVAYLLARLDARTGFVEEAERARTAA